MTKRTSEILAGLEHEAQLRGVCQYGLVICRVEGKGFGWYLDSLTSHCRSSSHGECAELIDGELA